MGLLDHKTAVITGGNSGIGLATAGRFIAEGADRVFITGRRQPELSAAATQLGSRAVAVPGDVGTPQDLDRLYAEVDAAGRGLDVVVANAGSTRVARLGEITRATLTGRLPPMSRAWCTPCKKPYRCLTMAPRSSCSGPPPPTVVVRD